MQSREQFRTRFQSARKTAALDCPMQPWREFCWRGRLLFVVFVGWWPVVEDAGVFVPVFAPTAGMHDGVFGSGDGWWHRVDHYPLMMYESSLPPQSSDDTISLVNQAMKQIEPQVEALSWQAFIRTTVDGRAAIEVAEELEMPAAAVRKAKSRTLQRLRKQLGDNE